MLPDPASETHSYWSKSVFTYQTMQEIVKNGVRGGVGEIRCRDYLTEPPDGMRLSLFGLNEMAAGATIPEHKHEGEAEFYFIVSGSGTGLHNGREFPISPGDAWLCRAGETHGLLAAPTAPLTFISLFFR